MHQRKKELSADRPLLTCLPLNRENNIHSRALLGEQASIDLLPGVCFQKRYTSERLDGDPTSQHFQSEEENCSHSERRRPWRCRHIENVERPRGYKMLAASDTKCYCQGKKKKKAAEA
jgi:hypothetical protein